MYSAHATEHLQPLTSGGAPVALSVGGKECMALMQRHAEPFSFGAAVGVPSVVDEFERDVELQQEQEQERELEQEQRVPVLDTSREHTWENVTAAISLPSASRFASQQSVAVRSVDLLVIYLLHIHEATEGDMFARSA